MLPLVTFGYLFSLPLVTSPYVSLPYLSLPFLASPYLSLALLDLSGPYLALLGLILHLSNGLTD